MITVVFAAFLVAAMSVCGIVLGVVGMERWATVPYHVLALGSVAFGFVFSMCFFYASIVAKLVAEALK